MEELQQNEKNEIIDDLMKIQQVASDFQTILNHDYRNFFGNQEINFCMQFMFEISRSYAKIVKLLTDKSMEGGEA